MRPNETSLSPPQNKSSIYIVRCEKYSVLSCWWWLIDVHRGVTALTELTVTKTTTKVVSPMWTPFYLCEFELSVILSLNGSCCWFCDRKPSRPPNWTTFWDQSVWNLEMKRVVLQLKVIIRTKNKMHAHLSIAFIKQFCSITLNQDNVWLHYGKINPDSWTFSPGFLKDFSAWKLCLMAFKTEYQLISCSQANTVGTVY